MKERIYYTKPSITERGAAEAERNGGSEQCYVYINRFEELFKNIWVQDAW